MIGLIMAGGKGTRMQSNEEKLLLEYKKPLVLHVIDALKGSNCFEKIIAATSPNSPQTQKIIAENNVTVFETLGENFVADLK
jgi:adenosylcobinamide-phosphate guanylyltransferase